MTAAPGSDRAAEITGQGQQAMRRIIALQCLLLRLEVRQRQIALQIEDDEQADQYGDSDENESFFPATRHADLRAPQRGADVFPFGAVAISARDR
jgi:hypothetical protein